MEKFHLYCFLVAAILVFSAIPVGIIGMVTGYILPFAPITFGMVFTALLCLGIVLITSIISEIRNTK